MSDSKKNSSTRCQICSHKLSFILSLTNQCACDRLFCNIHLAPEKHQCTFDHRQKFQEILKRNNPIIEAPKIANKI